MKIMLVARDTQIAFATSKIMNKITSRLVPKGTEGSHEFLALLSSPEIPRPEGLMDFEPDILVMEFPKDTKSNEAELLMLAEGQNIPILCWAVPSDDDPDSPETIDKIVSELNIVGLDVEIFESMEDFYGQTLSFIETNEKNPR